MCLLVCFFFSNAQTINSKLYNYFDGMPSDDLSFVNATTQSGVYLCSRKGIIQFDGNNFYLKNPSQQAILNAFFHYNMLYYEDGQALLKKNYNENGKVEVVMSKNFMDVDPNNDHFENLFVDSKGRIWSSDFNNIKYLYKNQQFAYTVFIDNKDLHIPLHFIEMSEDEIWVFSPKGLYVWNSKSNLLLPSKNTYLNSLQFKTVVKNNNQLIISTKQGALLFYDLNKNALVTTVASPISEGFRQLVPYKEDLFCISEHEIYTFKNNTFSLVFGSNNFNIKHFEVDEHTNNFWAATSKGLLQLHLPKKGLTFLNFPKEFSQKGNVVVDVIEPVKNEFWVLTSNNQVLQFKNSEWNLLQQFPKSIIVKSFTHQNGIYVTTTQGVFKWQEETFHKLNLEEGFADEDVVKSIIVNNQLWVLSSNQEILKYNLFTGKKIQNGFSNPSIFWKQNKWNDITVDHQNTIWLVGWMPKGFGICKYNEEQNAFVDISSKEFKNHRDLFVGDYYNRIYTDDKNNALFSAYGGFSMGNQTGKLTKKIDVLDYAIDDTFVTGLLLDEHENVFFATNAGLHVYLKALDKVVKINSTDGLTSNILQFAFKKISNNRLLLGGENQVTMVDTKEILQTALKNELQLTKILVNGTSYDLNETNLVLKKDQNNIALYFSTFSFIEGNKVFYEYSVNNGEWISLGNQAELIFNYLPPGNYNIKIKAKDYLGNEQKKQLHFNFDIKPPFTRTPLFYIIIGFLGAVTVYGLFKYSVYRKTKEKRYQLKIKDAEMKMLRAQMNPHFMFNTLNSINSYIIQNKTEDASKYLGAFSKLMRNILESSKQQFIPLKQEIRTTKLYVQLEEVRLEHSFDFELIVDEASEIQEIMIPPLIVQPFAENAIWHGLRHLSTRRGKLTVRFLMISKTVLQIDIEDNGIGREKSSVLKANKKQASYGVQITEERIKALHDDNFLQIIDLYDDNNEPTGTKISIYLTTENYD